jgi:formylglycine-generating enzyme
MKRLTLVAVFTLAVVHCQSARADSFGSGANAFDIDFVTIGNPGNAADTTGNPNPTGSVSYTYRIGKYEIPESMIAKANALGSLSITTSNRGANKPATLVSWNEAARFVNWLNVNAGSVPAYKFRVQPGQGGYTVNENILLWSPGDPGYDANNPYRNSRARYFLPSVAEWYKAAYYDPENGVYYNYPTGSNTIPTAVASGTAPGTAVFNQMFAPAPADYTLAGGLSPYGTMGQGGNVFEMHETDVDLVNDSVTSWRVARGGFWELSDFPMLATQRSDGPPNNGGSATGFRVASLAFDPPQGDYNNDGVVDAADYVAWRKNLTKPPGTLPNDGTGFFIGDIQYLFWTRNFGEVADLTGGSGLANVPEPTSWFAATLALTTLLFSRRRN